MLNIVDKYSFSFFQKFDCLILYSAEAVCKTLMEFSKYDATLSHLRPDFCYSPGAKMNPKDPEERKVINEERRKLKTTLSHFKSGQVTMS